MTEPINANDPDGLDEIDIDALLEATPDAEEVREMIERNRDYIEESDTDD